MYSQNKTNISTTQSLDEINFATEAIKNADRILIGIGSGISAAGGLSYTDPELAKRWYPEYFSLGKHSISEIMGDFWPTTISDKNAVAYWGFWAQHIHHIRYEAKALQPYQDLFDIVRDKDYFLCSTNVDGQLEKAGFDKRKIFAPQGDYALFQCEKPCSQDVYDNKAMIDTMLENMVSPLDISKQDIPHCPRCGRFLIPNLRCDFRFVGKPHMENLKAYQEFLDKSEDNKLVLLELGVGFNTPGIIRLPFERITAEYANANLIRVNFEDASVNPIIQNRSISIMEDIQQVLLNIRDKIAGSE